MIKLLIISDDFTGALDTGVQLTVNGAATYVATDIHVDYSKIASNIEVLVIDAETRHLEKAEAYQTVFSIVQQANKIGIPYIYKKTDSVLRGNIGAELTAALEASGTKRIHFVPAFPQIGRTTVNGIHYINAVPVAQSTFGQDRFEPVRYSDIKEIVASQSEAATHLISTDHLESCTASEGIIVYDSTCNQDLENIATELMKKDEMHVIAGCAGFAGILSKILNLEGNHPQIPDMNTKLLVACGSINPVSVAQCNYSEKKGSPRFKLAPGQKLNPGWTESSDADTLIKQLYEASENNPIVILDTNGENSIKATDIFAESNGISKAQIRTRIVSVMGHLLEKLIESGLNSTILMMGGDLLYGFVHQAGIQLIFPVCEMECGVVLSQLEYNGKTLNVISKSGGFGQETMFHDLSKMLSKLNEERKI